MDSSLPLAVIAGGENFVAKKLAEKLVEQGLVVKIEGWDEVDRKINYYFNFESGKLDEKASEDGAKICVVVVNKYPLGKKFFNQLKNEGGNWRVAEVVGVYGEGMDEDWFLTKAISLAAKNKNLVLPPREKEIRAMMVDDAVEGILKSVLVPGTSGKYFLMTGERLSVERVAEVLVDEAKMTRLSVIEEEVEMENFDIEDEERSRKELRWEPVVEFENGVKEVLRERISRVDEEGRNKKKVEVVKKTERLMEVMVEEEVSNKLETTNSNIQNEEDEEEEIAEEEVVGKEFEWKGIEPIVLNSKININPSPRSDTGVSPFDERENKKDIKEEEKVEEKIEKKKGRGWLKWWGVGVVGAMVGLLVWPMVVMAGVGWQIKEPLELIESKEIKKAEEKIEKLRVNSEKVERYLEKSGLWKMPVWGRLWELTKIVEVGLDLEERLVAIVNSSEIINGAIFEEKIINWESELASINKNLGEIESLAGLVSTRLTAAKTWLPGRYRNEAEKLNNQITEKLVLVRDWREAMGILPEFLGLDGKRREYLVLLQNEMEIRATGGFIGSYGILSFEEGRLISFDIKDVYEADGQLKGHVEPPEEIKKYLGEAGWFMRDSNWQPNFPAATADILWFLEKETGRKVDGVIGVNLAVARGILGAIGEIYVPDFKEKVNKDNLYEQAEFYAETKFFPGSVQKASFLSGLGKQLFEEIKSLKSGKRGQLLLAVAELVEANELQIKLNEEKAATILGDLGWDGSMFEGRCSGENCYADYLFVVESNLGVNKANYFIYRAIEKKVEITEHQISRELTINYENTAKSLAWPGGDYKNYLRVYLPAEAELIGVEINSNGTKQTVDLANVKVTGRYGRKEVGLLVGVPIQKKVGVTLKYISLISAGLGEKFSYLDYVQKQSGFGDTGMVSLVSIPAGWQPVGVQPAGSVVSGKILFNQKLSKDLRLGIEISK